MVEPLVSQVSQARPSWRGVFAGLLIGIVIVMAMISLALVLSSFMPFDLKGTSIAAGIYAALTALLSAFFAGFFAVKYSAPETLLGNGSVISPKNVTLTGILTAASILFATTLFTMNGATSILRGTGNVIGTTVSSAASTTANVLGSGAVAVGAASQNTQIQQKAQEALQKASANVSREDIESWIAKNTDGLNKEQVSATVNVLEKQINQTKQAVENLDFTNLDTWKNLDEHAKQHMAKIEKNLTGDDLIVALQKEGLSQEQALQIRDQVVSAYSEYKHKTEEYLTQTKQSVEDTINQTLQQAEDAARKVALYTGLFWLISALLTFFASIAGAKRAASDY
ncbi:hypothetical protein MOMA_08026 [Moraxella macacae 0408225]|uniref:CAP-Gly protein n=1 Tax=Moraxella macacae 0408225 TaxID=1230338 RepID=L2F7P6_9GAMM|nr:hypothetical protein [Moraxella macacae]ELA08493.1 hypothetical protein MOMA_08026 [Moraxella macacae 0408225]